MNILNRENIDISLLNKISQKPALYEKGEEVFWDDEHISKGMLEAHLNRDWDAGSYKHETINTYCDWIAEKIDLTETSTILDLGCGPGLYSSNFSKRGYKVTGIDYSKRSIDYAKDNDLNTEYIYKNYLQIDYDSKFDLVMIIYYDLAALSFEDRNTLLKIIKKALKPNGYFIFDLMTPQSKKKTSKSWSINNSGGFWKAQPYIEFFQSFEYENDIILRQHSIIEEDGKLSIYRLWDKYYSYNEIELVIKAFGLEVEEIYSNLAGEKFTQGSETIAIIAKNKKD